MANDIAKRAAGAVALPANLREMFDGVDNDEFTSGVSMGYPVLSIKGKTFHISRGGEVELVTDPNSDPEDEVPANSLEVVILRANKAVSKIYYEGGFEDGSAEKPTCYSNDGIAPADDVEERQSARCANCPQNQWGARITENGKKAKACRDARRVAIAPAGNIEDAMLLRVPAASLKPLMVYGAMLSKKGVPLPALVTRLSFDHSQAYPLLTFKHVRLLDATQAALALEMRGSEVVEAIINGTGGAQEFVEEAAASEEGDIDAMAAELKKRAAAPATAAAAKPKATPKKDAKPLAVVSAADVADVLGDGDAGTGEDMEAVVAAAEAALQAAAAKPKATAKPAPTPKPKTAAAAASGELVDDAMGSALDKLLGDFDDEE